MDREAAADTRHRKTGRPVADLQAGGGTKPRELGWTAEPAHRRSHRRQRTSARSQPPVTVERRPRSALHHRVDVDPGRRDARRLRPRRRRRRDVGARVGGDARTGHRRRARPCVEPRPRQRRPPTARRMDGRCGWNRPAPTARRRRSWPRRSGSSPGPSTPKLDDPAPSTTVDRRRARRPAGRRRRGGRRPRSAGGRRRAGRHRQDHHAGRAPSTISAATGRLVFGVAPTAKAAHVLRDETGMETDTVAKLLHEWHRDATGSPTTATGSRTARRSSSTRPG